MDARGQGGGYAGGDTGDPVGSGGPTQPGFLTRGLESPETYYYRRVFVDAVRAVQVLRGYALVDAARVAVVGASQGGGIALAVAGTRTRCRGRPLRAGPVPVRHPPRHADHRRRAVPRDRRLPRHPPHGTLSGCSRRSVTSTGSASRRGPGPPPGSPQA